MITATEKRLLRQRIRQIALYRAFAVYEQVGHCVRRFVDRSSLGGMDYLYFYASRSSRFRLRQRTDGSYRASFHFSCAFRIISCIRNKSHKNIQKSTDIRRKTGCGAGLGNNRTCGVGKYSFGNSRMFITL